MADRALSRISLPIPVLKSGKKRPTNPYGVMIHQTGSGIVRKARAANAKVFEYAAAYYARPDTYWAHYLINYDGARLQITREDEIAYHCGLSAQDRQDFLSGRWKKRVSKATLALWNETWAARYTSPSHLYPARGPNLDYIAVELLPLVDEVPLDYLYTPPGSPWRHTHAQLLSVADLVNDIADRWNFPDSWAYVENSFPSGRLVGHEDVNPLTRSQRSGGWDPGYLRAPEDRWFDFGAVRALMI